MNENLFARIQARMPQDRSRLLLETDSGRRLTFREMEEITARYAGLMRDLGAKPGDRLAAQVDKSVESLLLYLACLRAGVAYLPLNTAYRESEIEYFLADAEPIIFVHSPRDASWVAPICARFGVVHRFTMGTAEADRDAEIDWASRASAAMPFDGVEIRGGDDLAAILYTSGTTGRSKGAMVSHRNLSSNAETLHRYWGFRPDDVLLHALPLFHVHGLFVAANTILLNGGRMIFHHKFDAAAVVPDLVRSTVFMGVPTYYTRLLAEKTFDRDACRNMRLFISGSAPLLAETFHQFRDRSDHTILERYGMTETGMNTSNPLSGERRGGTVGLPLPGIEVRVVKDALAACPPGAVGQIQVKGPNVLPGYWRMPDKTREEFTADGFFKTGDLGIADAEGYISIAGRSKDLVISGGYNIYPKEVELLLDVQEGVVESAVFGLPHPDFGEAVAAALVMKPGVAADEAALIGALKGKLANFKLPKRLFIVDELPRNTMGKVQKNELRLRYDATFR
ncbi:MAG: malonyl-CoA synthase [Betaproteobacteria bacterium]|nr:malonyl-CoA synthase [Betaproteobacteria bacterium]